MRRKPITDGTKELVARAIVRSMEYDRQSGFCSKDEQISTKQLCDAVVQCGIDPRALAIACSIEITRNERVVIDEIDSTLGASISEDYSLQFLDHLCGLHQRFREIWRERNLV